LARLGQKPRRNQLVAAIVSVGEYAPSRNPGPSTGLSCRKGLGLSAGSPESMALVAYDTDVDPDKLQRKLVKRWGGGVTHLSGGQRAQRNWQTWIPSCREFYNIMAEPPPSESCTPWWDERWVSRSKGSTGPPPARHGPDSPPRRPPSPEPVAASR